MNFRAMQPHDWPAVSRIYEQGIATGNATFETKAPLWEKWNEDHLAIGRLVATEGEVVMGWVALSAVSGRCVYGGVAEVSVYVAAEFQGKGVGIELLHQLVAMSEKEGIWTLQAGIFPENAASIRLHEKAGFRNVGYRERIGKMKGVWRDTVLLERRSTTVGAE